ncbi:MULTISPECIES: gephyrin-like molybdotransferase Glp [unclassified Flavobacterium]|uniref:molybdopterin molybdotransferase MoeA n=1 Tax=unclassified Flavobacterium TaxID=196869 RepID=UPI0012AA3105|nr:MULTISPECIES: gephyrin-like molybdotransferase Glp [unclassified Flavobacterium]MBF4487842.1 molybdopterin molybdotransferase MoeA [Flavobacterium sp. CSZ]QGK72995.1 molybdopterin molybdenumtransferase MoeA [Flavobacterium sp. SLB02]
MIQVEEALSIIAENSTNMPVQKIQVSKSLGYILAETVYSPIAMPPFRQSAMDGYAFIHSEKHQYDVVGISQAGDHSKIKLKENEAVRIFTGAHVPDNADTVIMQEHVMATESSILITRMPERYTNVRNKGEQIGEEEVVFKANTLITPAAIGFLACLGITEVEVYKKPKVAILVTGNELVKPGKKLSKGKIYESNSVMLQAALQTIGVNKTKVYKVKDNLKATKKALKEILKKYDIVLISGGISVGDYDFVKEALLENDVQELFYKINQKPGKPMFFGSKNDTLVFALPGNPASSLTNFYIYVCPAIKNRMGFSDIHLKKMLRKLNDNLTNTTGKTLFLKALYDQTHVTVLDGQSSAMLNTFAIANSLLVVPNDVESLKKGQLVTILPID